MWTRPSDRAPSYGACGQGMDKCCALAHPLPTLAALAPTSSPLLQQRFMTKATAPTPTGSQIPSSSQEIRLRNNQVKSHGGPTRESAKQQQGREEIRVLISTDVLLRGSQPPGRLADDQLRHPLEPGAPHAAYRPGGPAHESRDRAAARRQSSRGDRLARQGLVLELSPARGAERDPLALHEGHAEDAPDLQHPRHRGQEAPHPGGRLRGAEGVQPRL